MTLTAEQHAELSRFPLVLRELLLAEVAIGNSIVEVGHSFPAPPVGCYIKLANQVSTRPRDSGDGIDFYDRNSSIYSGEFTDAKRFFFILEPPNPPPPEPDMDAIRKSHEPHPDALSRLAQRPAASRVEVNDDDAASSAVPAEPVEGRSIRTPVPSRRALTSIETATGATRLLHFRDRRPPHEVQFALERNLMTLFSASMDHDVLRLLAERGVNGADYAFELCFEAAMPTYNCYSLRVAASWGELPKAHHEYFRTTSDSWFSSWTRDLMKATPPEPGEGSLARYRELSHAALQAEAHLDSVVAVQQTIVAEMKRGGSFGTSHKEGGTSIFWRDGKFVRSDYGEDPGVAHFTDEADFLAMLRRFCQWEVAGPADSGQRSEFDAWKLIWRRLRSS